MKNTNQFSPNDLNQSDTLTSNGKTNNSTAKTLVAIAAGAAAGAVTAMLLTPKTGAQTRKAIADGASKLKDGVTDSLKQGMGKFNAGADRLKDEVMGSVKQGVKNAAQTVSDVANSTIESLSDQTKQGYEKPGAKTPEGKGNISVK